MRASPGVALIFPQLFDGAASHLGRDYRRYFLFDDLARCKAHLGDTFIGAAMHKVVQHSLAPAGCFGLRGGSGTVAQARRGHSQSIQAFSFGVECAARGETLEYLLYYRRFFGQDGKHTGFVHGIAVG